MAEPTLSDVHVDVALTDYSRRYMNAPSAFVARRCFPLVPTAKQSNKYFVYDKASSLRTEAQRRAPNTEAAVRKYTLSDDSFDCVVWSVASDVSEQIRVNADVPLDPEEDAARLTVEDLQIRMEVEFSGTAFASSVWDTDKTVDTQWNDPASQPIEDIATGIRTILSNTGLIPNRLVMGANVWFDGLMNHPDIIARLPDNAPRIATPQFLANLLGIDEVLIASSIRNTAGDNLTASYSFNVGKHALLCYTNPNPGPRSATAGLMFNWTGLVGGEGGIRTKRLDMPWKDALPRVESDMAFDFKVVGSDLGYYFPSVVA